MSILYNSIFIHSSLSFTFYPQLPKLVNQRFYILQQFEAVVLSYSLHYQTCHCSSFRGNEQELVFLQFTQSKNAFVQTIKFSVVNFPCARREKEWDRNGILWCGSQNHQGYLALKMARFAPLAVYCFNVQIEFKSQVLCTMIKVNGKFMSLCFIDHKGNCSWARQSSIHFHKEDFVGVNINCEVQSIVSLIKSLFIKKLAQYPRVLCDLILYFLIYLRILIKFIPNLIAAITSWAINQLFMTNHIGNKRTDKSTCICSHCAYLEWLQVAESSDFEYFPVLEDGLKRIIIVFIKYKNRSISSIAIFILNHNFFSFEFFCQIFQILIALYC